jgi:O-antigen ligase
MSTGRRVRWRGQLGDPNELSVFVGACLPLLFALTGFWKSALRWPVALAIMGVGLYAVILSQSRGGQLVIATVFAIYFVSRFGAKGLIGAIALALPVVALGGREGLEADESAGERLELLYEGATIILHNPIRGIGTNRFGEHTWTGLTAHNAYVLAAAELGFPGFFMWTGLVWTSLKVPIGVLRRPPITMDPQLRPFAMALLVSFVGMGVGIFFLSFTYKQLLFVWLGITGALYGIVRKDDPEFKITMQKWDYIGIFLFDVILVFLVYVYTRLKAAH